MAYKIRFKKEKECPFCDKKFYGYKNQIYCKPSHSWKRKKYNHISNYPPYIKAVARIQAQNIL